MSTRIFLYSSTAREKTGGVQAVYARLAAGLRQRGYAVTEAWAEPGPERAMDEEVVPLARLLTKWGVPKPYSIARIAESLRALLAALRRNRPALVNLHFVRGEGVYFVLFKWLFGYKLVLSAHGSDVLLPTEGNARALPFLLPFADALTAVSQQVADRLTAYAGVAPEKVHVIPNGIDYDFWSGGPAWAPPAGAAPTIFTAGRLRHVKGYDVLIRALARVRTRLPDARLVIAGAGSERDALQELARRLEVHDAVEFAGYLSREAVRDHMARSHVFALASRSEGMPLVLLEAMAAGMPCVATRVGGVPDVMPPETGRLVPPEDPEALADALTEVLSDEGAALRLRTTARSHVQQFSAEAAVTAYAELFARLVQARREAPSVS